MRYVLAVFLTFLTTQSVLAQSTAERGCFSSVEPKVIIETCTAWLDESKKSKAAQVARTDAGALERRANAFAALRQYDAAIQDLLVVTRKGTGGPTAALNLLGGLYVIHDKEPQDPNNLARGIAILSIVIGRKSESIQMSTMHGQAHSMRGLAFSYMSAHVAAKEEHTRAVELAKGDVVVAANRSVSCYLEFKGRGAAMEACLPIAQAAVSLEPITAEALHTRGMMYEEMSRIADAKKDFARAIELDPGHTAAIAGLKRLEAPPVVISPVKRGTPSKKEKRKRSRE